MTAGPLRRILGLARRAVDPTDDAGLLARFAANEDADAFELLVWRHGGMVSGAARRILGDVHAAEDAFQATFLALARQAKSVRKDGCVAAWLHRVARRVAMRAKKASGGRQPPGFLSSENQRADAPRSPENPVAVAERRELSQVLDEELDRLPERFRRPVVLCYLEGRSTAEVAERLGCPRGTVLSRLATAREKLRIRLMRRGAAPAILPPLISSLPVIHGGLISSTVRAAVANTATPQVIVLCDGVLKAMILSKLKMTATVVMTLGLIGGGAGWMMLTPGGPGTARAGANAKGAQTASAQEKLPVKNDDEAKRRLDQLAVTLEKLRTLMDIANKELTASEEHWTHERIESRLHVVEAEERCKRLEAELADRMNRNGALLRALDTRIAELNNLAEKLKTQNGKDHSTVTGVQDQEALVREKADQVSRKNQKNQEEFADAIAQARRKMVGAEEQLSLLDRLTSLKRRSAEAQAEDIRERISQLTSQQFGQAGAADSTERKVKNLDKKLDDVLRELTELRRELRK